MHFDEDARRRRLRLWSPDVGVPTPETAEFGDRVADALDEVLGHDLVGVYSVGSVALGGFVPGERDVEIAAVSEIALSGPE